ncbi:MAG TPA: WbqC family protein [Hyphomicrobiales bacterium]|nr:WbqC family protein [Candidatus Defluviicoccus seviourii]HQF29808.1 WbqC family protein [Hyphomicrobiales bacterium]
MNHLTLNRPIVSIHQPAYLPWLGYIDRIRRSDLFIFLDTVQFQKNSFQNRNKVRMAKGWTWLTLPVESKGHREKQLRDIMIDNRSNWQRKHWATIAQNYSRAPYMEGLSAWLSPFYEKQWIYLGELCAEMLAAHLRAFGIATPVWRASEMEAVESAKGDLVLKLCRQVGAGSYISGPLGRGYLDAGAFEAAGIQLVFDDYRHPVYQQVYPGFESHMAAIDWLANVKRFAFGDEQEAD